MKLQRESFDTFQVKREMDRALRSAVKRGKVRKGGGRIILKLVGGRYIAVQTRPSLQALRARAISEHHKLIKTWRTGTPEEIGRFAFAEGQLTILVWLQTLITLGELEDVKEFRDYIRTKDEAIKAERDALAKKVPRGKSLTAEAREAYTEMHRIMKADGCTAGLAVKIYTKRHRGKAAHRIARNFPRWERDNRERSLD